MLREELEKAQLTNRRSPGTAAGAASASPNGEAVLRGRVLQAPLLQRHRREVTYPGHSSPLSRPTMTTTQQTPTAPWMRMECLKEAWKTSMRISPHTFRSSSALCYSLESTSSPCACSAATRGLQQSRKGSRALECGSSTPTVISGNLGFG